MKEGGYDAPIHALLIQLTLGHMSHLNGGSALLVPCASPPSVTNSYSSSNRRRYNKIRKLYLVRKQAVCLVSLSLCLSPSVVFYRCQGCVTYVATCQA